MVKAKAKAAKADDEVAARATWSARVARVARVAWVARVLGKVVARVLAKVLANGTTAGGGLEKVGVLLSLAGVQRLPTGARAPGRSGCAWTLQATMVGLLAHAAEGIISKATSAGLEVAEWIGAKVLVLGIPRSSDRAEAVSTDLRRVPHAALAGKARPIEFQIIGAEAVHRRLSEKQ